MIFEIISEKLLSFLTLSAICVRVVTSIPYSGFNDTTFLFFLINAQCFVIAHCKFFGTSFSLHLS